MMLVIEDVRVHILSPAPTEEDMDVSNRMLDFVFAACEGLGVTGAGEVGGNGGC